MNAQLKKGVLELIVLESVRQKDMYGYELVEEVSKVVDVNEGTIYPLLKRLTNEKYFETYLRESTEGPPRKYYHLTAAGVLRRDELENEWQQLSARVWDFLNSCRSMTAGGIRVGDASEPDERRKVVTIGQGARYVKERLDG